MSALPCTSKHKSKYPWGALQKCRGMSSPGTLAIPSVCPNAGVSPDTTYFKLVAPIISRPSFWPSKDGDEMLDSRDKQKRPHLGDPALSSAKSSTKCVHPHSRHTALLRNRKDTKGTRGAKRRKYCVKNILPNKTLPVCPIPPTSPGFYFCQGMNKAQYRGGGEPRCLRLPALGWAESRRQLIQQEPPGHCRFNRCFVQHRRFRKGNISNLGCKQGWEKLCVRVCVYGAGFLNMG